MIDKYKNLPLRSGVGIVVLNKENIAELASVIVIVIESPLPESSDTTIFFKIALDPAGVV